MPRYYFHVFDGELQIDQEGSELADPDTARRVAIQLGGALIKDDPEVVWRCDDWRVSVQDQAGSNLFALSFVAQGLAVEPTGSP